MEKKRVEFLWNVLAALLMFAGVLLLFIAFCAYAFTRDTMPDNPYVLKFAVAGDITLFAGFMMAICPIYKGKEGLEPAAEIFGAFGHAILLFALAAGLILCMWTMFTKALSDHPVDALPWLIGGTVLYFIDLPFKPKPPTPEEAAAKEAERQKKLAESKARLQEHRMEEMKAALKKSRKDVPLLRIGECRRPRHDAQGLLHRQGAVLRCHDRQRHHRCGKRLQKPRQIQDGLQILRPSIQSQGPLAVACQDVAGTDCA